MTESSTIPAGAANSGDYENQRREAAQQQQQPFLTIRNIPVYFQQDWGAGIGGGLWSTGLAMAKYLQTEHAWTQTRRLFYKSRQNNHNEKPKKNMTIVELGSGNGLLSLCWLALFAALSSGNGDDDDDGLSHDDGDDDSSGGCSLELIVTDTLEHLPLIQKTLQANQHVLEKMSSPKLACRVKVMEHQWGDFEPRRRTVLDETNKVPIADAPRPEYLFEKLSCHNISSSSPVDLIIGSDLAYRVELYDPLIASFTTLAKDEQTIILLGCTMADTTPEFFTRLGDAGFVYTRLADHLLDPSFRGPTFGIFCIQKRPKMPSLQ